MTSIPSLNVTKKRVFRNCCVRRDVASCLCASSKLKTIARAVVLDRQPFDLIVRWPRWRRCFGNIQLKHHATGTTKQFISILVQGGRSESTGLEELAARSGTLCRKRGSLPRRRGRRSSAPYDGIGRRHCSHVVPEPVRSGFIQENTGGRKKRTKRSFPARALDIRLTVWSGCAGWPSTIRNRSGADRASWRLRNE